MALHDRTVAVLDALAYVSMDKNSPAVAVGLRMNPLQLVVATNEDTPTETMLEHLNTICSILKKISDTKFPHNLSHVNLRKVSPKPDLMDMRLEALCNDLFLRLYKYSYGRWKEKHLKRWKVVEAFSGQLQHWADADQETERDKIEQKRIFFRHIQDFWISALALQDILYKTCRPGCKTDINEMGTLKTSWQSLIAESKTILELTAEGGTKACDYWAKKVAPNGKPHVSAYETHSVMI